MIEKLSRADKIKKKINELNSNLAFNTQSEINALPSILLEDEEILAVTDATYLSEHLMRMIVATEHRLFFVKKAILSNIIR
ncbi:hypothetical protein [Chryseobacterium sp. MMS23-Vi53]|uniref:hypothetical protein n=1 Tax=Chryseobacterium sp. MMS23-Vi53 TaxID=3386644 RepID=UPI0039E78FB4